MNAKEELIEELEEHIMQVRDATFKNPFASLQIPREMLALEMMKEVDIFEKLDFVYKSNSLRIEIDKILEST